MPNFETMVSSKFMSFIVGTVTAIASLIVIFAPRLVSGEAPVTAVWFDANRDIFASVAVAMTTFLYTRAFSKSRVEILEDGLKEMLAPGTKRSDIVDAFLVEQKKQMLGPLTPEETIDPHLQAYMNIHLRQMLAPGASNNDDLNAYVRDKVVRDQSAKRVASLLTVILENALIAEDQIAKLYNSRSGSFDFPDHSAPLDNALDALDGCVGSLRRLNQEFQFAEAKQLPEFETMELPAELRSRLYSIRRSLMKAIDHRKELKEQLLSIGGVNIEITRHPESELRASFDIMSGDVLQALVLHNAILRDNSRITMAEIGGYLRRVAAFVEVGIERLEKFKQELIRVYKENGLIESNGTSTEEEIHSPIPYRVFVMAQDLQVACEELGFAIEGLE